MAIYDLLEYLEQIKATAIVQNDLAVKGGVCSYNYPHQCWIVKGW